MSTPVATQWQPFYVDNAVSARSQPSPMSESPTKVSGPLPPPQGYVAEKVSILVGALKSVLRRMGLAIHTVDDATPILATPAVIADPSPPDGSSNTTKTAAPQCQPTPAYNGDAPRQQWDQASSARSGVVPKVPPLHSIGHNIDRMLHGAGEFSDTKAVHVAHEALEEDRLHRQIAL